MRNDPAPNPDGILEPNLIKPMNRPPERKPPPGALLFDPPALILEPRERNPKNMKFKDLRWPVFLDLAIRIVEKKGVKTILTLGRFKRDFTSVNKAVYKHGRL